MLICGKRIDSDRTLEVRNPYDNALLSQLPIAEKEHVDRAVASARRGFELMRKMPAHQRADILFKTAGLLRERIEDFAHTLASECGKTIREARGEVGRAIETITLSSEEAKRIMGETVPFDASPAGAGKSGYYTRVPIGVVAAISPFNFPLNLVCHKVAPALAAGNSVVLKPASATPLIALKLGETFLEAGLPPEALGIIIGPGDTTGAALVSHPDVRMISFTGSRDVGRDICRTAGMKKIALELGSNSAVVVTPDADLGWAVERIVSGAYALAGQVCISVQNVYVHTAIADEMQKRLLERVTQLKLGNQLHEDTDMGPLITATAVDRVAEWVDEAVAEGATLLTGGERKDTFITPMVLSNVTGDMRIVKEEAFAPLINLLSYQDITSAIERINQSYYGLQAGIFTQTLSDALLFAREVDAGGIIVNDVPTFRIDLMPYGGMKHSGLGREGPRFAIREMTEPKLVAFHE